MQVEPQKWLAEREAERVDRLEDQEISLEAENTALRAEVKRLREQLARRVYYKRSKK